MVDELKRVTELTVRMVYPDGTGLHFKVTSSPESDGMRVIGRFGPKTPEHSDAKPGLLDWSAVFAPGERGGTCLSVEMVGPTGLHYRTLPYSPGMSAAISERVRQQELFSPDHDRGHPPGLFAREAACYARWAAEVLDGVRPADDLSQPEDWPTGGCAWRPRTPLRALQKSAALAAAEIDRSAEVDRAWSEFRIRAEEPTP